MISVYRASAGSGKTYKLAYEYIRLLLGQKDDEGNYTLNKRPDNAHRSILAITFTNKATDEMKRRIIHELAVLSGKEPGWEKPSPYLNDLMVFYGCTEEELKAAAERALKQLLYDFGYFQVSTIDSFFQSILRTFANEAELSGNYDLELNRDSAINEGLARMFQSLDDSAQSRESKRLSEWIKRYLMDRLREGKKVNLMNRESTPYNNLLKLIRDLSDEIMTVRYSEMMEYLSDPSRLERFKSALAAKISSQRKEAREKVSDALAYINTASEAFPKGASVKSNVLACLEEYLATGEPKQSTLKTYISKTTDTEKRSFILTASLSRYLEQGGAPGLQDAIVKALDTLVRSTQDAEFYEMLASNTFVLGILAAVFGRMEEYLKENNTFLIGDTNGLLNKIIGDDETPFIYERMGIRLTNFLIDEFQDTSRLQWENLRPLLAHSLSEGNDSLIIGDEKQCIYRFRNSDPTLLSEKVFNDFRGSEAQSQNNQEGDRNWRSLPAIVGFNSRLFAELSKEYASTEYSNVAQLLSKKASEYDAEGYVEVVNIAAGDDQQQRLFEMMAAKIKDQFAAGYQAGDIAVLVRKNQEGTAIVDYLTERQRTDEDFPRFPIVTEDVVKISSSEAVRWIISQLRLSVLSTTSEKEDNDIEPGRRNKDVVALAGRYDSLFAENHNMEQALKGALNGEGTPRDVRSSLVWDILSLVRDIAINRMPRELLETHQAYISAFLDLVYDYSKTGMNDLRAFLKWWDTSGVKANLLFPGNSNALSVMTIHKSKGLEFPCVHIPIEGWTITNFKGVEWFDLSELVGPGDPSDIPPMIPLTPSKAMENTILEAQYQKRLKEVNIDELNALYVAFTRAERELCVWNMEGRRLNQIGPKLTAGINSVFASSMDGESSSAFVSDDESNSIFTLGKPTSKPERKAKKKNATEPSVTLKMPDSQHMMRENIWQNLNFNLEEDE
ncbi:MAG: UvrD-helicase domain-containing protein [Paramuribaculum sp.]|nr:UvrD-helicase domain-containing protein [Paramuribaculum sp.]